MMESDAESFEVEEIRDKRSGKRGQSTNHNFHSNHLIQFNIEWWCFWFYDEESPAQGFEKLETCNQQFGLFERGV